MNKSTIIFTNPTYLKTLNEQLLIVKGDKQNPETTTRPLQDIAVIILENPQITITQALLAKCIHYNIAVISCDDKHHPIGLFLNLDGNSLQSKKMKAQIESSAPLKKQLWQQTVYAKIINQATVLQLQNKNHQYLLNIANNIKSGDADNAEAKAASYYWKNIFPAEFNFVRNREGFTPNNILNYGYAILRALVARSLVAAGLLPTLGIFHKNQYNAYCLADDIMEPYRPFIDLMVCNIITEPDFKGELTNKIKLNILNMSFIYVKLEHEKASLFNSVQKTAVSFAKCFDGSNRKIIYPTFV